MSEEHSKSMTKTTNLSIEGSGEAKFGEKTVGLKATISRQIEIKESRTTTKESSTTIEREVTYAGGQPLLYAEYVLLSQFSLQRANGIGVKEKWEATNTDEMRQVGFPNNAMQKISAKTHNK